MTADDIVAMSYCGNNNNNNNDDDDTNRYLTDTCIIMRQGRRSEATEAVLAFRQKSLFVTGRTSMGCQKNKKTKHSSVPGMSVCVIQHRYWPLRSTILNAHGTNASPDGLCTRTHTNEAFSYWFCCSSFRVDRARRGNVCLEACLGRFSKS